MILIVTPDVYQEYSWELSEMFRLRHRVFKERMGWVVSSENGEERDQFDDCKPTYVLAFGKSSKLVGCMRLLPTTGPYMLKDVFPKLLNDRTPPSDPNIWECSRLGVEGEDSHRTGLAAKAMTSAELFCGAAEFFLSRGIHSALGVFDASAGRVFARFEIRPEWKAGPYQINDSSAMAGMFKINQQGLKRTRAIAGISSSVLSQPPFPAASALPNSTAYLTANPQ